MYRGRDLNSLKKMSIEHSIEERRSIIDKYLATGYLDRNEAIAKVMELRAEDSLVFETEMAGMVASDSVIPLARATDEQIVNQLRLQMDIMMLELGDG